jgi:hypothetical protein
MLIIRDVVLSAVIVTGLTTSAVPAQAPAVAQVTAAAPVVTVTTQESAPVRNPKPSPSRSRAYAKTIVSKKQFKCLKQLWAHESNWNHKADNANSSAYGIPQLLKMTEKDPYKQIDLGIKYIRHRYGSSCEAWEFWQANGWY